MKEESKNYIQQNEINWKVGFIQLSPSNKEFTGMRIINQVFTGIILLLKTHCYSKAYVGRDHWYNILP